MTSAACPRSALRDHTPWTDLEHDAAVAHAHARAEAHNRRQRRIADLGFFATAAFTTLLFLGRDGMPQLAVVALACAAALALVIALRAGSGVRSVACMVEEWRADIGADPLGGPELLLLRSHARTDPAALRVLNEWTEAGHLLRQRDFDALVDALRASGLDVPERGRSLDLDRWAEAL